MANDNSRDQELENILTNRDTIVTIVEDESDVAIWKEMLLSVFPEKKFRVSPFSYSTQAGKGKTGILKKAKDGELGPYMIGCIDSDYDWILDKYTDAGRIISSCKYIFQTIAYGVENLLIQPYDIAACMRACIVHDCDDIDAIDEVYGEFIKVVSSVIYKPLLWHLVRIKLQVGMESVSSDWMKLISCDNFKSWVADANLSCTEIRMHVAEELVRRADDLVADYESRYPQYIDEVQILETELNENRGLTLEKAYLFAPTHMISDFVDYVFFKPLENRLKLKHFDEIMINMPARSREEALKHYKSEQMPFVKLRRRRFGFLFDSGVDIARAIQRDISVGLQ